MTTSAETKVPESVRLVKLTIVPCYAVYDQNGDLLEEVTPRLGESKALDIYQSNFGTFLDVLRAQEPQILESLRRPRGDREVT